MCLMFKCLLLKGVFNEQGKYQVRNSKYTFLTIYLIFWYFPENKLRLFGYLIVYPLPKNIFVEKCVHSSLS